MEDATSIGLMVAALGFVAGVIVLMIRRSHQLLEDWAQANGYQIRSANVRPFIRGPFWFSGKGQVVYRVQVTNEAGAVRWAWVRLGGWMSGLLADKVEVRWDDES
jgi:hypothetical protein